MKSATVELLVLRGEVERLRRELADLKRTPAPAPVLKLVVPELLEPRKPPKRAPARMPPPLSEEARSLLNQGKLTPARATRLRAMQRKLCGCNRCVFAERDVAEPALTFAEGARRKEEWGLIVRTTYRHKEWAELLEGGR